MPRQSNRFEWNENAAAKTSIERWNVLCKISITNDIERARTLAFCYVLTECRERGEERSKERMAHQMLLRAYILWFFLFVSNVYHRSSVCPRLYEFHINEGLLCLFGASLFSTLFCPSVHPVRCARDQNSLCALFWHEWAVQFGTSNDVPVDDSCVCMIRLSLLLAAFLCSYVFS